MPFIEFDNVRLFYEEKGQGEVLILIPGFASGAWAWNWQVEQLAESYKVITFDPRGISRSSVASADDVSIKAIAEDVAGLLDRLSIEKANVAGVSFGGFIAQEFALRFGEKLDRLVLTSTSCGGDRHIPPRPEIMESFTSSGGKNFEEVIGHHLKMSFTAKYSETHADVIDEYCRLRIENVVGKEIYKKQLAEAMSFDSAPYIENITAKTLVITGSDDVVVPSENSHNLANMLPNAQLEVFEGAGHMLFVEQAEEFNRKVKEFLAN